MTKNKIKTIFEKIFKKIQKIYDITADVKISIYESKHQKYGKYTCNIALQLSPIVKIPSLKLAQIIEEQITSSTSIKNVKISGPGFINIF